MPERDEREERVGEAVAWYFQAVEAGHSPKPADFLARFPDLRSELESFLADKAAFDRAAGPPTDPDATIPPAPTPDTNTIAHVPSVADDATLPPSGQQTATDGPLGSVRYFGDYELLAEIARGGMGVVFKARQVSLNREVALKMILSGQLASAADIARFHAEAEAAANLDHPNILPIYEVGEHHGQQYFAMKLAPGGSLARKIAELKNDPRAAVEVFAKVCRAVDFAHRRGILHRDLKPGNILLDADGTPYVTDFGLAKKVEGDSNLTQSGAIVGTPSYMAPEQARAEKGLTTAADVYALGAILYELLTGQPPFRGPTVLDTILQVLEKEPADPRSLNPKADRDLSVIAFKCLEKGPGKRYESAGALADDLDRWASGEPITARSVGRGERARKWVRRNPAITALVVALLIVLVAGVAASTTAAIIAANRAEDAERNAKTAEAESLEAAKQRKRAEDALAKVEGEQATTRFALAGERRAAYVSRVGLAHREALVQNWARAVSLLSDCPADLRGWEWNYLRRTFQPRLAQIDIGDKVHGVAVAYRPDGRELAVLGYDGLVHFRDGLTHSPLRTLEVGLAKASGGRVAYFPDGSKIVVAASDRPAVVWELPAGRRVAATAPLVGVSGLVVSPDGRWVVTSGPVRFWDARTGAPGPIWAEAEMVAFAPSWAWAAVASGQNVRVVDPNTGKQKSVLSRPSPDSGPPQVLTVAPDGRRVAGGYGNTVVIWNVADGKVVQTLRTEEYVGLHSRDLQFSPDGQMLVLGHTDRDYQGGLTVWDTFTGRVIREPVVFEEGVEGVAFRPDGRQIVSAHYAPPGVWYGRLGLEATVDRLRDHQCQAIEAVPGGLWSLWTTGESEKPGQITTRLGANGHTALSWAYKPSVTAFIAVSRTEKLVAVAESGGSAVAPAAAVRLYDVETGREVRRLAAPAAANEGRPQIFRVSAGALNPLKFSPDGRRLLVARTALVDALEVWAPHTGKLERRLPGAAGAVLPPHPPEQVTASAWAADGKVLAVASKGCINLWDVGPGEKRLEVNLGGYIADELAFSPDGRKLAVGVLQRRPGSGEEVVILDTATGKELVVVTGLIEEAHKMVFSPDGTRLVTADTRGKFLKVWDVATGQELLTLGGIENPVGLGFTSNDQMFAAGPDRVKVFDGAAIQPK